MSDYDTAKQNSPYLSEQEFTEKEEVPPGMEPIRPHLEQKIKQEPTDPTPEAQVNPTDSPKISNESKKLKDKLNGPYWTCKETHGRRSFKVSEIETNDETAFKKTWDNVINLDEAISEEN